MVTLDGVLGVVVDAIFSVDVLGGEVVVGIDVVEASEMIQKICAFIL